MDKGGTGPDTVIEDGLEGVDLLGQEVPFPLVLGGKSMMELAALTIAIADDTAS